MTGIVESNHGFRLGMLNYEVTFNLTTGWRISLKVIYNYFNCVLPLDESPNINKSKNFNIK